MRNSCYFSSGGIYLTKIIVMTMLQRGLSTRPNAVITSWELSFDHIRRTFPQAADLLSLMLRLNHQAIPQFLIQSIIDTLVFSEVTAMLLNFSLVRAEIGAANFRSAGLSRLQCGIGSSVNSLFRSGKTVLSKS
ncbi:hypothetical protein ABVK25_002571 [Lepraria finkii]|uniref:Uncharacterized protein n=1 Tax=Lepraria finkii TaxID=1340010 RepID=A0ABR4BG74_9LECA